LRPPRCAVRRAERPSVDTHLPAARLRGGRGALIEFRGWRNGDEPTLVAVSRRESEADFRAALPLIMSLGHERRPEWSARPDDILTGTPF
jgi:hypothetical protein